ncbi:hypothetical protein HDV05_007144 [Chytridiales sp. JEL 0842]|nr:hypothetical protein HDV05_007144 [Chytridiales sp. JEL 0842]
MNPLLALSLLTLLASQSLPATQAAVSLPSPLLIGQWGKNIARAQVDPAQYEPPLATICNTKSYNVIHISGVSSFLSVNNLPSLDLSTHCSFPTNTFPGWPKTSKDGLSLLYCPAVGRDIQTCQSKGIKVVLTINPNDFLSATPSALNYAETAATHIWNLYLGGSSNTRPFGNGVVLDGVNLQLWANDNTGVRLFVDTLRTLMGGNYILSGTPRCQFPDYAIGPPIIPSVTAFDYIVPTFIQSPNICGYRGNNPEGFWTTLEQWRNYARSASPAVVPLVLGLVSWPVEPWAQAALGDYIPADAFITDNIVPRIKNLTRETFGGFSLQDISYDVLNKPCYNDAVSPARTYSDVIWRQMTMPVDQAGNATVGQDVCLPAPVITRTARTSTSSVARTTGTKTAGPIWTPSSGRRQVSSGWGACVLVSLLSSAMMLVFL